MIIDVHCVGCSVLQMIQSAETSIVIMAMGQGIGAVYILAEMKQTARSVIQCGSKTYNNFLKIKHPPSTQPPGLEANQN